MTTIFFTLFITLQVFGWILKPAYEETISQSYIPVDQIEKYTIKKEEFLPFFVIVENALKF